MFNEMELKNLPEDVNSAGEILCGLFFEKNKSFATVTEQLINYENYVEAFAILEALMISNNFPFDPPIFTDDIKENIKIIMTFFSIQSDKFNKNLTKGAIEIAREKYRIKFDAEFSYQFSDVDLNRIQELINQLRENIRDSKIFDENHRERLLNKLEKLQKELHKKMSSLDKLWGLIGDAGIVFGKFGNDVKPLVDRILEIANIAWQTQARSEELPSGTNMPLLFAPHKDKLI